MNTRPAAAERKKHLFIHIFQKAPTEVQKKEFIKIKSSALSVSEEDEKHHPAGVRINEWPYPYEKEETLNSRDIKTRLEKEHSIYKIMICTDLVNHQIINDITEWANNKRIDVHNFNPSNSLDVTCTSLHSHSSDKMYPPKFDRGGAYKKLFDSSRNEENISINPFNSANTPLANPSLISIPTNIQESTIPLSSQSLPSSVIHSPVKLKNNSAPTTPNKRDPGLMIDLSAIYKP